MFKKLHRAARTFFATVCLPRLSYSVLQCGWVKPGKARAGCAVLGWLLPPSLGVEMCCSSFMRGADIEPSLIHVRLNSVLRSTPAGA